MQGNAGKHGEPICCFRVVQYAKGVGPTLIELAIEALEATKAAIDAEIAELRRGLRP